MAGQGCGSRPTGEKRPRIAAAKGDRTAQAPERCQLCSVLKRAGLANHPHAPFGTTRGLRVALVDDDEGTCLAAREMLQAQRDGWTLEVYHPSCLVREPAGRKGSSRPNALEGDQGPRSPPDIVLIGLSGREDARLACVRRIKALAPDLPVLIISGDSDAAVNHGVLRRWRRRLSPQTACTRRACPRGCSPRARAGRHCAPRPKRQS